MSPFESILNKIYSSSAELEQDAHAAATKEGFVLTKYNTDYASDNTVLKRSLRCYKSGTSKAKIRTSAKTDCPFKLNYRIQAGGSMYFFTSNHCLSYNHPMDPESTVTTALARRFTPTQVDLINSLRALDVPVAQIVAVLRKSTKAIILNKDVYNSLQRGPRQQVDGQSQVLDLLDALEGNADYVYDVKADEDYQLILLIFAEKSSLTRFSQMSFVLLMDATYKTNRYNMPLLLISSVDPFGRSYVVACCLLRNESTSVYDMALASFKKLFGSVMPFPNTIVTDQERSLMNAIDNQFPGSSHQLCRWHLSENIKKNFAGDLPFHKQFCKLICCKSERALNKFIQTCVKVVPPSKKHTWTVCIFLGKSLLRRGCRGRGTWGFAPHNVLKV